MIPKLDTSHLQMHVSFSHAIKVLYIFASVIRQSIVIKHKIYCPTILQYDSLILFNLLSDIMF